MLVAEDDAGELAGYRVEGVLRDEFILGGRPVDDLLMALELGPA